MADDFDARHSARGRRYVYRVVNRRAPLTFDRGRAWRVKTRLDAEAMHEAARALIGRHDFSTFRDAQCQAKSPVRTLDRLDVMRDGDAVLFEVERALVPASPGPLDGRLAGRRRFGPLERAPTSRRRSKPPTAAAAARSRRPPASISRGSTIEGSALRP